MAIGAACEGRTEQLQCVRVVRCVGRLDEASCSSILGPSDLPTPRGNVPILSPACMLLRCSAARSRSSVCNAASDPDVKSAIFIQRYKHKHFDSMRFSFPNQPHNATIRYLLLL